MRNVLILPDGTTQSFQYPDNRTIELGEKITIDYDDGSHCLYAVIDITHHKSEIHYHLELNRTAVTV